MVRVKAFKSEDICNLEQQINQFISVDHKVLKDVKYGVCTPWNGAPRYSALVICEDQEVPHV